MHVFICMPWLWLHVVCVWSCVVACVQLALAWGFCGESVFTITLSSCQDAVRKLSSES